MRSTGTSGSRRLLAALLVACSIPSYAAPCFAELPPAPPAEVQASPEARQQFQLGVSLLQDPDGARYEEAFKAFMRAYRISPSWKILGNLGLSAMKLERFTDGIQAYERYLGEGGQNLDATERQQIEKDLSVMKGTSGTVTLLVTGAAKLSVQDTRTRSVGGPVVNNYEVPPGGRLVLKLAAGEHTLVATGERKRASLELSVEPGANVEQTLMLGESSSSAAPAAATTSSSPSTSDGSNSTLRTTGLIVGGVGVAALIGGGVTGIIGMSKKSDFDDRCPDKQCPFGSNEERASLESDKDSIETMETLTTAFLIGGGVLTAVGVTLFVVGGPSESERVSVAPSVGPGAFGLSAQGAF